MTEAPSAVRNARRAGFSRRCCDKTTPALLLGATSMNLPAIYLPAGPMLRGNWKGRTLGSGSDAWK